MAMPSSPRLQGGCICIIEAGLFCNITCDIPNRRHFSLVPLNLAKSPLHYGITQYVRPQISIHETDFHPRRDRSLEQEVFQPGPEGGCLCVCVHGWVGEREPVNLHAWLICHEHEVHWDPTCPVLAVASDVVENVPACA